MSHNPLIIDHVAHYRFAQQVDLGHLMRGAETVEEMYKRYARFERDGMADESKVLGLLNRGGAEHTETGGASCHYIAVITKYGESLRGQSTGSHVEHDRRKLACDLVHIRDHQEQALGGGECSGERACLQSPVYGSGGATFTLHLHDRRYSAPNIGHTFRGPLVCPLGHRRGGSDRIYSYNFVQPVSHTGYR